MSNRVLIDRDVLAGRTRLSVRASMAITQSQELPPVREAWIQERQTPSAHAEPSLMTWEQASQAVGSGVSVSHLPEFTGLLEHINGQLVAKTFDFAFSEDTRQRHVLAIGKTGSGKTSKFILPLIWSDLLDPSRTVIVFDAKGDLTGPVLSMVEKARGRRAKVHYISPLEPDRTAFWNPLHQARDRGEAQEIAMCLSAEERTHSGDGMYFKRQAENLIAQIILLYKSAGIAINGRDMKQLFDLPPSSIVKELARIGIRAELPTLQYALSENKNAETTLTVVANALSIFMDQRIAASTSRSEFEFDQLADEPCVLIIRCPEGVQRIQPLMSIFVSQLFSWVIDRADRNAGVLPVPMSCYIDEFASALGRLPMIEEKINTFRSRDFSFIAAVQSIGQLRERYGSAASMLLDGFSTLIGIPPLGLADAQCLSEKSGTGRFLEVQVAGPSDPRIVAEHEVLRHVLSPTEIANPRRHPEKGMMMTILLPEMPPLIGYAMPIWKLPGFEQWDRVRGGRFPQRQVTKRKRKAEPAVAAVKPSGSAELQPGITDPRGMSEREMRKVLQETMAKIGWADTSGSAKKWWEAFMNENDERVALILRLAEELANRNATITEFFLAYVYSNTDNIMANLHYLDYTRAKKEEEAKRRKAARDGSGDE